MHFDGNRMFVRRSRQLNLAADKPTDDACLMVRWMASRPIGDTLYATEVCDLEMEAKQETRHYPNNHLIAVKA